MVKHQREITIDDSNDALAAGLLKREVLSLDRIYDRYGGLVYSLAVHLAGCDRAEEITQQVFLELWDEPGRYGAVNSLPARLIQLTWDQIRAERRRADRALINGFDEPGRKGTGVRGASEDLSADALPSLLGLTEDQRDTILLIHLGKLTQSEAAVILRQPLSEVERNVRQGMRALRVSLESVNAVNPGDWREPSYEGSPVLNAGSPADGLWLKERC